MAYGSNGRIRSGWTRKSGGDDCGRSASSQGIANRDSLRGHSRRLGGHGRVGIFSCGRRAWIGEASAQGGRWDGREAGRRQWAGRSLILTTSKWPPATMVVLTGVGRRLADGSKGHNGDHGSFRNEMHCPYVKFSLAQMNER